MRSELSSPATRICRHIPDLAIPIGSTIPMPAFVRLTDLNTHPKALCERLRLAAVEITRFGRTAVLPIR